MIRRRYEQDQSCVDINLVPMIDMMLFLLIFFVVNSTFVREVGLEVPKPKAVSAAALPSSSLVFSITAQNKIVHGDLKPANIMVTPERVSKIMDFGLAHREILNSPTAETGSWQTADQSGLSGTPAARIMSFNNK